MESSYTRKLDFCSQYRCRNALANGERLKPSMALWMRALGIRISPELYSQPHSESSGPYVFPDSLLIEAWMQQKRARRTWDGIP